MSARVASGAVAGEFPLLETKLVARARPSVVRRTLLAELDRLSSTALTLVDAPVGFGKSMLVQSWCAETEAAVAWVSLDPADNDASRLWAYVATAVDRVRSGLGRSALQRLRSPGVPPEVAVDELVNGLVAYGEPLAIVLDDLHVVSDPSCLSSLERVLEHLPDNARVIATTRADPPLPLGRLRARGALGEIRAAALAFTADEARELLVEHEGIPLDDEAVRLLHERTEGWPAGLYLAALWLRELDDPAAGVRDFHGDHRHVADYLTSEVLDALDADTREFMLGTSVLGSFNGPLCDAVLERSGSADRLSELERMNGFVIPLDAHGDWYRYHHLFGELLQLELANDDPDAVPRLHRRAGDWCAEHGYLEAALEHAAAAGDERRVATLLADEHLTLLRSARLGTVLHWCTTLSNELLLEIPVLPLAGAMAAGLSGRSVHERRRLLALAEQTREDRPARWTPYHEILHGIASATWVEKDVRTSIELVRRAADIGKATETEGAVPALASLAFLLFLAGELEEAHARADETLARPEIDLRPHGHVLALATLSLVLAEIGQAASAEEIARRAVATADEVGVANVASGGVAHVALASALAARGELREAESEAVRGEKLRRHPDPEAGHLHALLVLAGIRARRGRLAAASSLVERVRGGLESFDDAGRLPELADAVAALVQETESSTPALAEAPTTAEMSVLELLAGDLSQREIGARLYLSVNTVKTHTRALYRKLGVSSREEAVTRATALGLLECVDSPG